MHESFTSNLFQVASSAALVVLVLRWLVRECIGLVKDCKDLKREVQS